MDLSTELPHEVDISLVLLRPYRVEIIPEQNTVRVLLWTQAKQQFTKLHCCSIAALSTQYIDVLN